jgi:glycosyltransferase involved in cell wall biosynthesis
MESIFMTVDDRVAHLLHVFPSFEVGGPQVRFADIANRLAGKYQHTLISLNGDTSCASRLEPESGVRLMPLRARKSSGLDLGNLLGFRRLLSNIRPDVLLTYNWGAIEWAMANRWFPIARHIHFEDGFGPEETLRQLRRRVLFRRLALGKRTMLVVPSLTLQRLAMKNWRINPAQVVRIPNGIDCERFARQPNTEVLADLQPSAGTALIGTIGALRPEKNFARLIRCVAAMPDTPPSRLVIVGEGPERSRLEATTQSSGIVGRVTFTGFVEPPERIMGRFDIFACSSDTEQMPYALIEAMAAGLPIVATDVGDVRAMVSEENRNFVVSRENEAAFAASLARLVADPYTRHRIGAANRARALRKFNLDAMCRAYNTLFSGAALIAITDTGLAA